MQLLKIPRVIAPLIKNVMSGLIVQQNEDRILDNRMIHLIPVPGSYMETFLTRYPCKEYEYGTQLLNDSCKLGINDMPLKAKLVYRAEKNRTVKLLCCDLR